jgi:hypothetical protein
MNQMAGGFRTRPKAKMEAKRWNLDMDQEQLKALTRPESYAGAGRAANSTYQE